MGVHTNAHNVPTCPFHPHVRSSLPLNPYTFFSSRAFTHHPPFTSVHRPRDSAGRWGRVGPGVHPWSVIQAVAQSLVPTGGPCGEQSSDRALSPSESPPPTSPALRFLIYKTRGLMEESFARTLPHPTVAGHRTGFTKLIQVLCPESGNSLQ